MSNPLKQIKITFAVFTGLLMVGIIPAIYLSFITINSEVDEENNQSCLHFQENVNIGTIQTIFAILSIFLILSLFVGTVATYRLFTLKGLKLE